MGPSSRSPVARILRLLVATAAIALAEATPHATSARAAAPEDAATPAPPAEAAATPTPSAQPHNRLEERLAAELDDLDLPLTYVWPESAEEPRALIVFISGDGGWAWLDDSVAHELAGRGIATIGWSSLKYFYVARDPAEVARDVDRVVRVAARTGRPVYLGGYSFGAEIAAVVPAAWTAVQRARIRGLLLIAPGESAAFAVNPLDWVRTPEIDEQHRVDKALRAAALPRVLCLSGVDDLESDCRRLADVPGVEVVRLPGDHHFKHDAAAVALAASRLFAAS